jgi:hypothetical protein
MIFMERSSDVSPKARGKFILLVPTLLPGALQAQVDTAWVRRYNGPGNNFPALKNRVARETEGQV